MSEASEIKAAIDALRPGSHYVSELRALGDAAVDFFLEALQAPDSSQRQHAAYMLGLIGSPRALEPLMDRYLNDEHEWVRQHAGAGLGLLGTAALPLALSLLNSSDERTRTDGAMMLGDIGHPEATNPLIQVLETDPHWQARGEAAISLGSIGGDKAFAALERASHDPDWQIRDHVAVGLGNLRTPEANTVLYRLLEDEHASVREEAAMALDWSDDVREKLMRNKANRH